MRLATLALALCCLAPTVAAQAYVRAIDPVGDPLLHGLDWRDGILYATETRDNRIVTLNLSTRQVETVVDLPFQPRGVAVDAERFRVSTDFDASDPAIGTVAADGSVEGSIPAPSPLTNGLTFHDGLLWASRAFPDDQAAIVGLDPASGAVVETVPFPSTEPAGIAFLGDGTLWATNTGGDSGSPSDFTLYHLDRATGAVLGTLSLPRGATRPRGLAFDGQQSLYVVARNVSTAVIYEIDLSASGNAEVAISDTALDFGVVVDGADSTRTLVITNEGDGPLDLSEVTIAFIPESAGTFTTTLTEAVLAPGQSRTFDVTFTAFRDRLDPSGDASGRLSFRTNDVQNTDVEVPLSAFAAEAQPRLFAIAPERLDFGAVRIDPPTSLSLDTQTLLIQNVGVEPLVISSMESTDPAFALYGTSLPLQLAPAELRSLPVAFRPTSVGTRTGTLTVESNDPESPLTIPLSGEGIDPDLSPGDPIWMHPVVSNPASGVGNQVVSLASPGDLTGDGRPDLVYASRNFLTVVLDANGWSAPPVAWTFDTCPSNGNCGAVSGVDQLYDTGLATGADLTGDAVPDVVIGTGGSGNHVYALNGATGDLLWEFGDDFNPFLAAHHSVSVRPGLDLTGDGIPEVASGTGRADPEGFDPYNDRRVYLFDGATGALLWDVGLDIPSYQTVLYRPGDGLGVRVAAGGDGDVSNSVVALDGADGAVVWSRTIGATPYLLVPVPDADGEDLLAAGVGQRIFRLDGATGTVRWSARYGGTTVWDLALIDRGGDSPLAVVASTSAEVEALDTATGTLVWSAFVDEQALGVSSVPDVDADRIEEVAVVGRAGYAALLSGADGEEIWRYVFSDGSFGQSGEAVTAVGDLDDNGVPEIAVGTRDGRVLLLFGGGGGVGTEAESATSPVTLTLDAPFPSPAGDRVTVRYRLDQASRLGVQILDVLGREVWRSEAVRSPGSYAMDVPVADLAPGTYVVRVASDREEATRRFVVVR
ncbi:MAG: choice-of-anchor D domain-containing protein [Bacteroidota bacterium]